MKTKTMKKLTAIMMSGLLMFSLAACGNEQQAADGGVSKSSSEAANRNEAEAETLEKSAGDSSVEETETESNADKTVSDAANTENLESTSGKTLVVYYSASGNTKEVAEYIAAATGGDLFELEPAEPYIDEDLDWTDENSRVCREHDNEEERNVELVSAEVPDWESYETVFVGYPIWWGEAPHIVYSLVENVSLKKKTVIPFSTSISSGLGSSGKHLKARAQISSKTKWLKGRNFYDVPSQKAVNKWVKKLKY